MKTDQETIGDLYTLYGELRESNHPHKNTLGRAIAWIEHFTWHSAESMDEKDHSRDFLFSCRDGDEMRVCYGTWDNECSMAWSEDAGGWITPHAFMELPTPEGIKEN